MSEKQTILIVDDDLTNRLVLKSLLREAGFDSLEAENGQDAVDVSRRHHVDIVLMDVMMPVMDGYEAARIIKSESRTFVPIIFLTAMTDEEALVDCIDAGGDDFLTKPYNHVLLRAKIDSMLRIRSLYQQIEKQNQELNRHNLRIEQEVNIAKKVFGNLLSNTVSREKTGLRYSMSSMSIFNGDMILAERNQSDGLDILISDFTGHGLSAAIGSIPVSDVFYTMTKKGFSSAETLAEANNKLLKLLPTQMFMAAAHISVDRINNVVTVINCGLPDLYLWRNGKVIKEFGSQNIPLGIARQSSEGYQIDMSGIEYGDRIFACTDGIMEAENSEGQFYGKQRMLDSMTGAAQEELIFDTILDDCKAYAGEAEQTDDITLLELYHQERVEYADATQTNQDLKPSSWTIQFTLDIQSLRNFDLLPYIMHGVNGLRSIPNSRSTVHTIVTEIYANALDHGILKLDSSMKSTPDGYMEFYQEKNRRLESYQEGEIELTLSHEPGENGGGRLTIRMVDSGDGFDFSKLNKDMSANSGFSGRGFGLISQLCKTVEYQGSGNTLVAVYEWEQ
jgi:CheY-like chemotaxis protein